MSVIDVLFMAIATAIVAVALYSSAGCGGGDFRAWGEEEIANADSENDSASIDSGSTTLVEAGRVDSSNPLDVLPIETDSDSAMVGDASPTETKSDSADDSKPPPTCDHANGLGQSYVFCAPAGTPGVESSYSIDMAKRARAAWTTPGVDGEGACADGAPLMVWRKTATSCAAWAYTNGVGAFAGTAGRVYLGSTACSCPSASCAAWN